jgi:hypothetical protein
MKQIFGSQEYKGSDFFVLDVGGEPIRITCKYQFDDLIISSPDGDVLLSWDMDDFDENKCIPINPHDNLKEISGLTSTHLLLRAKDVTKTLKVYLCLQRN